MMTPQSRTWNELSAEERGDVLRAWHWLKELYPVFARIDAVLDLGAGPFPDDLAAVEPAIAEVGRVLGIITPGVPVAALTPREQVDQLLTWLHTEGQRLTQQARMPNAGYVVSA
jgi:orotate phosphoribosyltransferase-like protein